MIATLLGDDSDFVSDLEDLIIYLENNADAFPKTIKHTQAIAGIFSAYGNTGTQFCVIDLRKNLNPVRIHASLIRSLRKNNSPAQVLCIIGANAPENAATRDFIDTHAGTLAPAGTTLSIIYL